MPAATSCQQDADDQDQCSRRQADGVRPVSFRKATPKALWLAKPMLAAIVERLKSRLRSSAFATSIRRRRNQPCGEIPVDCLNANAKWPTDKPPMAASSESDMSS